MKRSVLIIGAGIHGITTAVELAKEGNQVTVLDAKPDMLQGSSNASHNRLHLGYHYPRSKDTAEECRRGYQYFIKHFQDCLLFPDFYYAIAKNDSNVNAEQYKSAMANVSLPCDSSWPTAEFMNKDVIEDCFKVKEGCFDMDKVLKKFKSLFEQYNVKEIYDFAIERAEIESKNKLILTSHDKKTLEVDADLIINCTYTCANNIQTAFGVHEDLTPYKMEDTEICVVESDKDIPALTVMDGPFVTILPYAGKKNQYLVYDKINSVLRQEISVLADPLQTTETNWEKMQAHGQKYYPFFKDLKYKYSLYGNRPISVQAKDDDRTTKIKKHEYPIDFYSVLEGKWVSAPLVAQRIVKLLNRPKNALIGHTGFIGSSLKQDFLFDDFYNSQNIADIEGHEYDMVVSCANSSAIWKVNKDPEADLSNIKQFMDHIKTIKAKTFVLISSVEVYEKPQEVYEDTSTGDLNNYAYGKNRLLLEKFISEQFENYLIVRLGVTFGMNFKKNVIYDVLNNKELQKVNTNAVLQFYNVKNLMKDITLALNNKLKIINLATEPIKVADLYREVFGLELDNPQPASRLYDMRTRHAALFGEKKDYAYSRIEILNDLKQFKKEYEYKRI